MPAPTRSSRTVSSESRLTEEQRQKFDRDGFLIIPDVLSPEEVSLLLGETRTMLTDFSLDDHPMTKFSTGESTAAIGDEYFLTSGDKVRYFFEEDAFSPTTGELVKPKHRAINKIGHYLHGLCPAFREVTFTDLHRDIGRKLGFRDPQVLQSMVICKQPEIGGRVPPHQDSTFLYTDPPSAVGFWFALEDATRDNGCLSFARGSHKRAPLTKRFVREADGPGTTFVEATGARFPAGLTPESRGDNAGDDPGEIYEMAEVQAGSLVLIHGNILHKSEKNLSSKSRFIYTFHVIEGEAEYDGHNWLQPPAGGFSRLFDEKA